MLALVFHHLDYQLQLHNKLHAGYNIDYDDKRLEAPMLKLHQLTVH